MSEYVYEISFTVYSDRALTDDEQRLLGDSASDAKEAFGNRLEEIGGSDYSVNVHGPRELRLA